MKSKKHYYFNAVVFIIFFMIMGRFRNQLPLIAWMLIAVIIEVLLQIVGQNFIREKENRKE